VDAAERELGKVGPEVKPAVADCSSACSFIGRPETGENLVEQVLRESADPALSCAGARRDGDLLAAPTVGTLSSVPNRAALSCLSAKSTWVWRVRK
jgi:hypothetical protein